jgi:hypothetical protein
LWDRFTSHEDLYLTLFASLIFVVVGCDSCRVWTE